MLSIFVTCLLWLRLLVLLCADAFQATTTTSNSAGASAPAAAPVWTTLPPQVVVVSRKLPSRQTKTATPTAMRMVRNIDLPEALILYGRDVIYIDEDNLGEEVRPGLLELVQECCEVETRVIILLQDFDGDNQHYKDEENKIISSLLPAKHKKYNKNGDTPPITVVRAPEPMKIANTLAEDTITTTTVINPAPLLNALLCVRVQERAFGGSSGFGRKAVDPSWRIPLAVRCVALAWTLAQTHAARVCGMRVIQVNASVDDPLADYALLPGQVALEFGVDDIATPGSFWLNPPHPRDDDGNKVDPYELVERYHCATTTANVAAVTDSEDNTQLAAAAEETTTRAVADDDYLSSILADLAPL